MTMPLPKHILDTYTAILEEELIPAMGCTEPIAIAYAAAILRHALGRMPTRLTLGLSGNIIKNVKSVTVPMTGGLRGIPAAVAAGLISGRPDRRLEVLSVLGERAREEIEALLAALPVTVAELDTPHPFAIELTGEAEEDCVRVCLLHRHTNIEYVTCNGTDITARYRFDDGEEHGNYADRSLLTVENIVAYAEEAPLARLSELLRRQIVLNMAIAEQGLRESYGAAIGKTLYADGNVDLRIRARAYAAAGSDARMSGCEMPVCILSGSGNQGITASVPVVLYAREWGADDDTLLRALIISDLITVHQKTGIGCLSAYCGAISAGCGCGCGIAYLAGGRFYEVAHTLVNAVAILSGTICDGAKASCAAKIAMAVEAGIMGYEMMRAGRQFYGGDGIVTKGVENTIRNVGRLAREGMGVTDREIIRIMLGED